jgi:hypothetical protein
VRPFEFIVIVCIVAAVSLAIGCVRSCRSDLPPGPRPPFGDQAPSLVLPYPDTIEGDIQRHLDRWPHDEQATRDHWGSRSPLHPCKRYRIGEAVACRTDADPCLCDLSL